MTSKGEEVRVAKTAAGAPQADLAIAKVLVSESDFLRNG